MTQIDLRRLWWAGPAAILAAIAAVLLVRVIAFATLNLSSEYPPLTVPALVLFTAVFTAIAVLVFAIVARRASQPLRLYRRIALVTLIVSMIPDAVLLPGKGPGATWTAVLVLMVMHVAAYAPTVAILTRYTIRSGRSFSSV